METLFVFIFFYIIVLVKYLAVLTEPEEEMTDEEINEILFL